MKRKYKAVKTYLPQTESFKYTVYRNNQWLPFTSTITLLVPVSLGFLIWGCSAYPAKTQLSQLVSNFLGLNIIVFSACTSTLIVTFVGYGFNAVWGKWEKCDDFRSEEDAITYIVKQKQEIEEEIFYLDK